MSWHDYDEKLIRRGELILDLGFVRNYQAELDAMNRGKEGKPFRLTNSYVKFLAVVRYLYGMPYRQLEGFTRALERL
ncbi:MAG TPA: transposase [Candidatus Methanomethylicus sp.]|nr:transposase [Candidatus Methanomethylicus sp.]